MPFYRITATADAAWTAQNEDKNILEQRQKEIFDEVESFNADREDPSYYFLSDIKKKIVSAGIFALKTAVTDADAGAFLRKIGIPVEKVKCEEVTMDRLQALLHTAERKELIEDEDEPYERFLLRGIRPNYKRFEYRESMANSDKNRKRWDAAVRAVGAEETMLPELDRICASKAAGHPGHPVHYLIRTDDDDMRQTICRTLVGALYAHGRLKSLRYSEVFFNGGDDSVPPQYDQIYKASLGGTVVVRVKMNEEDDENDYARTEASLLPALCETMRKYRNEVLTVFSLPRASERLTRVLNEEMENICLVSLGDNQLDSARARDYLKRLAAKAKIPGDRKLYALPDEDRTYYPEELQHIFDAWFSEKLRTGIYPQYRDLAPCKKEKGDAPRGSAYDALDRMIGLSEAKEVIRGAVAYYRYQKRSRDRGVAQTRPAMHMCFTGNPGTAKTTTARLFARIMKENGLLSRGHLVECGRGDLVGKYVGWTAQTVQKRFREAMGGVLFIDEAYSLIDDCKGSFGTEAINTIVQEMENRREDLVVIFAGYPAEMKAFLASNPGLSSRIAFHVPFADYSADELCGIARLIAEKEGLKISAEATARIREIFRIARGVSDFGNGRYVRNLIESARMRLALRVNALPEENLTDRVLFTLEAQDFADGLPDDSRPTRRIGFAA